MEKHSQAHSASIEVRRLGPCSDQHHRRRRRRRLAGEGSRPFRPGRPAGRCGWDPNPLIADGGPTLLTATIPQQSYLPIVRLSEAIASESLTSRWMWQRKGRACGGGRRLRPAS
jgi:hypothetical protein